MTEKITFNPAEESEIRFKIKIEGNIEELDRNQSVVRFALTEQKSGKGWIFNTNKSSDSENNDEIAITIPVLKGMVSEGLEYSGKLEVILGNHYFTPTEMDVDFKEPLKVEATVSKITKSSPGAQNIIKEVEEKKPTESPVAPLSVKGEMVATKKAVNKEAAARAPEPKTVSASDSKIREKFISLCEEKGIKNPLNALKNKKDKNHNVVKNIFKNIIFN